MEKKLTPLQRLAYAWLALIIVVGLFMIFFLVKKPECNSTNFKCLKSDITANEVKLTLFNNLYEVELIDIETTCNLDKYTFNERYDAITFMPGRTADIFIRCKQRISQINLTLFYLDVTNTTHTDIITIS